MNKRKHKMQNFKSFLKEKFTGYTINVTTEDGIHLEGRYHRGSDIVVAHTHGTASFYNNEAFEPDLLKYCEQKEYGFLTFNNRGAHLIGKQIGAVYEKFSDSPKDIDAWLRMLRNEGIKKVILSGHSLGTEKIANYVKTNNNDMIQSCLFFAPSDTIGNQIRYEKKIGKNFIDEAKDLVSKNKEKQLLQDKKAHAGVLSMSAEAYLDFYETGNYLENALPFRNHNLGSFPIECFALVPTNDHYNITSTKDYIEDLRKSNVNVLVCDTDHDFNNFDTLRALHKLM